MTLQNRVWPTGEIVVDPARGLLMGNRGGRLHDAKRQLGRRRWQSTRWITCLLHVPGDKREVMGEGYTELFFLDEAVAFAAGHRPCAECRRDDYERFRGAWQRAFGVQPGAAEMDKRLHAERIDSSTKHQRRHQARAGDLPEGVFIIENGNPFLITKRALLPFASGAYDAPKMLAPDKEVTVLTPRCTVDVLRAGYDVMIHSSAVRPAP